MSHPIESERNVVITGLGIVSPIGVGIDPFWDSLANLRSGISRIESLDYTAAPGNVGAEVKDFTEQTARKEWSKQMRKGIRVMCREIQLGVDAALQAVRHSGLDLDAIDHERFGVEYGANLMFSPPDVLKDPCWHCTDESDPEHHFLYDRWGNAGANAETRSGMNVMEPLWLLKYLPNMPACHIGIAVDARGPNNSLTLDEASGNLALGEAFRIVQRGSADVMIAGVTGTRLNAVKTMHAAMWDQLAEYDDPPETWYRPFDATRRGQVVAEGACSIILEEESAAKARGATIFGRMLGSGSSCAMDKSGKANSALALVNAMRAALADAGLQPADVGHINAHGLATVEADREEAAAVRQIFGETQPQVPVTALKSCLGNSGSGCGLLELAGSILGLQHGVVPATLNYTQPDSECGLNVVHGEPLATTNKIVLSINFTRAGQAAAVVLEVA